MCQSSAALLGPAAAENAGGVRLGNAVELGRAALGWRTSIQGMAKPPVAALLPAHPQGCPWLLEPLLCWKNGAELSCLEIWGFRKPGRKVDGGWSLRRAAVGRNTWIQALGSSPEVYAGVNLVQ